MRKITPTPQINKQRFGFRGKKQRYSVFKAEQNKRWEPLEKEWVHHACEQFGLDPLSFVDPTDNPNRQWSYAWMRCQRELGRDCVFQLKQHQMPRKPSS